jgi:hypothetical protein
MLYNIPYPHIQRGYKLGEQYDDCPWERRNLQLFALFNLSVISVHFLETSCKGQRVIGDGLKNIYACFYWADALKSALPK